MKKLLIATTNQAKFNEISSLLKNIDIQLISLKDLGITKQAYENGKSLMENAIIKAKFYQKLSNLPTLSDDAGFEIDYLNGEPGVRSHRWVHEDRDSTDEEIIEFALTKMKHVPIGKRGAQLRLVMALAINQDKIITQEVKVRGIIGLTKASKPNLGFPYRSLLYLPQIKKYYNHFELTENENKQYNNRRSAIEKLKPIIKKYLLK